MTSEDLLTVGSLMQVIGHPRMVLSFLSSDVKGTSTCSSTGES